MIVPQQNHPAHTPGRPRPLSPLTLTVLAGIVLTLGTHGFSVIRPEAGAIEWVFLSAKLFEPNSNVLDNVPGRLPITLEIARLGAMAMTAGGFVFAPAAILRRVLRRPSATQQRDASSK